MSADNKKELRFQLLTVRKQAVLASNNVRLIQDHLYKRLQKTSFKSLGFYFPVRDEVDLQDVISKWLADDLRRVAGLPCVEQESMQFLAWSPNCQMVPGKFNIPIPVSSQVIVPEILIIPCVGFDKKNYRLGYGGGFYDRYLASRSANKPYTIGIAFSQCCVDTINPGSLDIALDEIITQGN